MQNQWLRNPERHERDLADVLKRRGKAAEVKLWRRMIHYALFAGCRSGQVLMTNLGEDLCNMIVWDESTRVIGSRASDNPPADFEHIRWTLEDVNPDVVITFGRTAGDAIKQIVAEDGPPFNTIYAPHPAARAPADHARLKEACARLKELVACALKSGQAR